MQGHKHENPPPAETSNLNSQHESDESDATTAAAAEGAYPENTVVPAPPKQVFEDDRPFTHGALDADAGTREARGVYLKNVGYTFLMITFIVWGVLPIYWASVGRIMGNTWRMKGCVVDFDGGEIGQTVTSMYRNISGISQLTWHILDAEQFPGGPAQVGDAVVDEQFWIGVVVAPNATRNLNDAIDAVDSFYNTSLALAAYVVSGRSENAYRNIFAPMLFAAKFVPALASRPNLQQLMAEAPMLVSQPLGGTTRDVRPFDYDVVSAVDFVGMLYLLILANIVMTSLLTALGGSGYARRLKLSSVIAVRLLVPISIYFFVTLLYCVMSEAFQVPFRFGKWGFVIYWMQSWATMCALGLAVESVVTLVTLKFVPVFFILWLIANVAVVYYPIQTLPWILHWGYASPFYQETETVRTVIFSTKSHLGRNFGINLGWIGLSCMTLPAFQWFARRREVCELAASRQAAESEKGDP
ncbi:hypothetical protein CONPUDRAFT_101913 [Coniophora puteana RWD-64-598 SS2]|uniref:DUF3533 domain-containing protein n=1 Tax=Coniophora puteana (strain RWD-64-598) TaxID=741705 RepID=A0A5M3MVQ9_CONPW|nr:uncharacterized protein CONPUDRAFT_101913 [Coniophora puteana RWD-64-598 SS2]EIW83216.1 hypothetical protein CONPUDRAFT_101913 [Coniophora puteana RWD-64-598 SS2]